MENNTKNQQQEEIDVLDMVKKSWSYFSSKVTAFLIFLLHYSIWIIGFTVLGVFFSIYLSRSSKEYYSSSVEIISYNVNCSHIIAQIDALDGLLAKKNYTTLASLLDIPENILPEVKNIKALYAIDINRDGYPDYMDELEMVKKNPQDTSIKKMSNYFYLKLEVYSQNVFSPIAKSLKVYMNKSESLERENKLAIKQKQFLHNETIRQIVLLDSLQKVEYFSENFRKNSSQQTVFMSEKERKLYHKDIIELYSQQLLLEKELELYSDVITINQDFPPLSSPDNTLILYLKKYVLIFFLFGFFSSVIWHYRKILIAYMLHKK